jgi:hypothetical protein
LTRTCKNCKRVLPLAEFYCRPGKGYRDCNCKDCRIEYKNARRAILRGERDKADALSARESERLFKMPPPDAGEHRDDKWARLAALALAVDRMATNTILPNGHRGQDAIEQSWLSGLEPGTCAALTQDQRNRIALNKHAADAWRHPERTR